VTRVHYRGHARNHPDLRHLSTQRSAQSKPYTRFSPGGWDISVASSTSLSGELCSGRATTLNQRVELNTDTGFDTRTATRSRTRTRTTDGIPVSRHSHQAVKTGTDTNLGVRSNNISKYIDICPVNDRRDRQVSTHHNRYQCACGRNDAQMFGSIISMETRIIT